MSDAIPAAEVIELVTAAGHLRAAKAYILASLVFCIYEYFITLDQEIHYMWSGRKFNFMTVLWVMNRYWNTLAYVVANAFLHIPVSPEVCDRWVMFPGAVNMVGLAFINATLTLRVYALYAHRVWVLVVMLAIYIMEVIMQSWALAIGVRVQLPPDFVGCILTGKPNTGIRLALFWIAETIFPSCILVLTFARSLAMRRDSGGVSPLLVVLVKDGFLYFAVIVSANVLNVAAYLTWPSDLNSINAPFCQLISAVIICRLILHLREQSQPRDKGIFAQSGSHSALRIGWPLRRVVREVDSTAHALSTDLGTDLGTHLGTHDSLGQRDSLGQNESYSLSYMRR